MSEPREFTVSTGRFRIHPSGLLEHFNGREWHANFSVDMVAFCRRIVDMEDTNKALMRGVENVAAELRLCRGDVDWTQVCGVPN